MFTLWLEYFICFFFLLLPHFYPLLLSPLSRSSTLFISSHCKLQFLHSPPTQAPAQRWQHQPKPLSSADNTDPSPTPTMPTQAPVQRRQCRLISSFSAPISMLSHFSSTLSLNLSLSQTPRPMITDAGFDFVALIDKMALLSWLGFMLMGSIFILMNGFWFCWWLMNGGWVSLVLCRDGTRTRT